MVDITAQNVFPAILITELLFGEFTLISLLPVPGFDKYGTIFLNRLPKVPKSPRSGCRILRLPRSWNPPRWIGTSEGGGRSRKNDSELPRCSRILRGDPSK